MKRSHSIFNSFYDEAFYSTVWDLVVFGTGEENEYRGIDPRTGIRMAQCSKLLKGIVINSELRTTYWKEHVLTQFKSYEADYKYKINVCWKNLFSEYSKDLIGLDLSKKKVTEEIDGIADHCLKIFRSKGNAIGKTTVYGLLHPHLELLSKPGSNAIGQYCLGVCYGEGVGVSKNLNESFKFYKLSARQGNANAQNNVGYAYDTWDGVHQNHKKAFKYYKKSADQESAVAQLNVAICYKSGSGVAKDMEKAFYYFKLSADNGDVVALNSLGSCYFRGAGVAKDQVKAFEFYKLSANQGHAPAQYQVGVCYEEGWGVEQIIYEAIKYYKLSAAQGNTDAQDRINALMASK